MMTPHNHNNILYFKVYVRSLGLQRMGHVNKKRILSLDGRIMTVMIMKKKKKISESSVQPVQIMSQIEPTLRTCQKGNLIGLYH